jgi:protease II
MDQRLFRKKVLETHTSLPVEMSKRDYEARIRELLETCEIIKMPKEVTREGRFYSHIEDFLYNQAIADDIEDVLNHSVWKSDGKIYFQLSSLERYMRKIQFKEFSTTQMGSLIRDKGGDSKQFRINKNTVKNLFFIPDPKPQDESKLNVPKVKDDVPF